MPEITPKIIELAKETYRKAEGYCSSFGDHKEYNCVCKYSTYPSFKLAEAILEASYPDENIRAFNFGLVR